MANYNLYKGISTGSITSATSSLRSKINTAKTNLSTFQSSLTDGVWKAGAKQTLFTAFDTINNQVCKQILDKLDTADTIAGEIDKYNAARDSANTYAGYINSATEETSASDIASWRSSLDAAEKTMEECERTINGLL